MTRRILSLSLTAVTVSALFSLSAMSPEARHSLDTLQRNAEAGNAEAMYRLSMLYERGYDSIPADSTKARGLLRNSAEAGYPPAMNYLGYLLLNSRDTSSSETREGLSWLEKAAGKGDPKAASNIGFLILNDTTGRYSGLYSRPDSVAASYVRMGAHAGLPTAKSMLADLYREGRGVERDTLKAERLYEEAATLGLGDAETRLINMMGPSWQHLSPEDALALGKRYFRGNLPFAGVFLLKQAYEEEGMTGAEAKALLSDAYGTGRGAEYSYDKSMHLLTESARAGYVPARERLAEILEMFPDAVPDLDPQTLRDAAK